MRALAPAHENSLIGCTLLRHLETIGELEQDDRQAVLSIGGTFWNAKAGDHVLKEGDRATHAVIVLSGLLKRYTTNSEGDRQIHEFYMAGDAPCLETLHMGIMDNSLAAVSPARLGLAPHRELETLLANSPSVLGLVWHDTLIQASILREWIMRNCTMRGDKKMAHLFCEIMLRSAIAGEVQNSQCKFPVCQGSLGEALGMSDVHVNRTLMSLRRARLVQFHENTLTVPSWEALVSMAEFQPGYLHLQEGCLTAAIAHLHEGQSMSALSHRPPIGQA